MQAIDGYLVRTWRGDSFPKSSLAIGQVWAEDRSKEAINMQIRGLGKRHGRKMPPDSTEDISQMSGTTRTSDHLRNVPFSFGDVCLKTPSRHFSNFLN